VQVEAEEPLQQRPRLGGSEAAATAAAAVVEAVDVDAHPAADEPAVNSIVDGEEEGDVIDLTED